MAAIMMYYVSRYDTFTYLAAVLGVGGKGGVGDVELRHGAAELGQLQLRLERRQLRELLPSRVLARPQLVLQQHLLDGLPHLQQEVSIVIVIVSVTSNLDRQTASSR